MRLAGAEAEIGVLLEDLGERASCVRRITRREIAVPDWISIAATSPKGWASDPTKD
jgi:hypothetical protein